MTRISAKDSTEVAKSNTKNFKRLFDYANLGNGLFEQPAISRNLGSKIANISRIKTYIVKL